MTTTYNAESKIEWRKAEIRDVIVGFVVSIVLFSLLLSGALNGLLSSSVGWVQTVITVLVYIAAIVFGLAGISLLLLNSRKKRNLMQKGGMTTDGWRFQWWQVKPVKAVWSVSMDATYNNGSLQDVESIRLGKRGKHEVFEFVTPRRVFTLPFRLANTDGVRDFLTAWIEANNGNVPAADDATAQALLKVLTRGKTYPAADAPADVIDKAEDSTPA